MKFGRVIVHSLSEINMNTSFNKLLRQTVSHCHFIDQILLCSPNKNCFFMHTKQTVDVNWLSMLTQSIVKRQGGQRATYRAPEYHVPPYLTDQTGRLSCFSDKPEKHNFEILLPAKFRWNPFNAFRGEVENVSANQRTGWPSCFTDRSEKYKLGRGRWDLASCQVSLNSVQLFKSKSRKCLGQSEARASILFFPISPKKTNLVEDVEILLPVKFRWILFSGFRGEVKNVSANQRPGWPACFSNRPEKHKLGRGRRDLASCQVSLNSVKQFQRSRKCLSQSEVRAAILFFRSARKNTNLVEDVEILLPVKFR